MNNIYCSDLSLKERCKRIQELDRKTRAIEEEKEHLYYDGLTDEQYHKLFDMVFEDGEPHVMY